MFILEYTTIRVLKRDKERLRRLAKLLGLKSISDALRYAISVAERELERCKGDVRVVLSSLRYAKDVGETDAGRVDEYLYSGEA